MYVSQIMDCFRDFDQKIILVKGIDQRTLMIIKLAGFHVRPDDNAMLVFCYIDREAGISYELLCAAHIFDDGEVAFEPGNDSTSYKFRYGTFQGEIADIKGYKPFGQFAGKVQMIVDHYSAPEDILEVRRIQQLDMSRAQGFPDDIVVYFNKNIDGKTYLRLKQGTGETLNDFRINLLEILTEEQYQNVKYYYIYSCTHRDKMSGSKPYAEVIIRGNRLLKGWIIL